MYSIDPLWGLVMGVGNLQNLDLSYGMSYHSISVTAFKTAIKTHYYKVCYE